MKAYLSKTFLVALLVFTANVGIGQISISGPECVTYGIIYQYNFVGNWQAGDNAKLCITGGTFENGAAECQADTVFSFVRVYWNENDASGGITLTSASGNASLSVVISRPLNPGTITNGIKQDIRYNALPENITCSPPQGGSCNTSYALQWESSPDAAVWTPVPGATKENLEFNRPLLNTSYFRRKTTEQSSGTIGYSDSAVVYVGPHLADHH